MREVWLSEGRIWPYWPIRRYLGGEIDVLAASAQCFPACRSTGMNGNCTCGALVRVFGAFSMHRKVEEVVGKWRDYMETFTVC